MKCNNCGAPLQLNQKFCPNCGSPNEQALKHVNDMENYDKKFNRTRSKVISNSKWFVKNITPIAVVMLSAIVLAAALIANNSMLGYRLAENSNKKYNKEHNDEIQIQLRELLDNEDYGTLYELYEIADRIIITDDYKYGWSSFYSILYDYLEIRRAICGIKEAEGDSSSYSWDDSLNRAARSIVDLEDTMNRLVSFDTSRSKESQSYAENILDKVHLFIKAYCDFTEYRCEIAGYESDRGAYTSNKEDIRIMRKKKFNPFVLLYIISAILLIISIAPISDTAAEIYRVNGRYAGYEEESLFNDFIEKDYAGLSKKVNYNKGIGKSISEDEKDYYTFVECYNIAVDYNMYVRLGDINKADELKEQFEYNTKLLQRKIFKEALETVKNTYIVVS